MHILLALCLWRNLTDTTSIKALTLLRKILPLATLFICLGQTLYWFSDDPIQLSDETAFFKLHDKNP